MLKLNFTMKHSDGMEKVQEPDYRIVKQRILATTLKLLKDSLKIQTIFVFTY